jgi:choline dehydrogenase-like flavoprotein
MQVLIALMRDGFHPESAGGTVMLQADGTPVLDYPLNAYFWDGARRALATMSEIQFAAGAVRVAPLHTSGATYSSWAQAKVGIAALPLQAMVVPVVSAHVMGGCPIGSDPRRAVVDSGGRHHHLDNVYVIDGSLFPTSIGANPQLSIYAMSAKLASALGAKLRRGTAGGD